jgi:hypothetical protein
LNEIESAIIAHLMPSLAASFSAAVAAAMGLARST